jgi:hypothetical protein
MASRTRPNPASVNASTVVGRFGGTSNPRVNTEDPLRIRARRRGRSPSAQYIST